MAMQAKSCDCGNRIEALEQDLKKASSQRDIYRRLCVELADELAETQAELDQLKTHNKAA